MINSLQFQKIQTLVFSDDIHGEFEPIVYKLNNYTETVLIVCGNIGMGFHKVVEVSGIANELYIGGAASVDRSYQIHAKLRSKRKTYWGNAELPIFDEEKLDEINSKYADNLQIVATHTCPSFAYPTTKQSVLDWLRKDEGLSQTLDDERHTMDRIFGKLLGHQTTITDGYYGHFHEHKLERHHGINFRLCDCGGMNEVRKN